MGNSISTVSPRTGGGPATVIDSPERIAESYSDYLSDESRYGPATADRLVLALDESHVARALEDATARGGEVTLSAGRTGIVGGAVPARGTLLSLAGMDRILGIRKADDRFVVRCEPGITIADLRERLESGDLAFDADGLDDDERAALAEFGGGGRSWLYPPDPTEGTAHLGATVATNASGARSFRYGATRRHVQGLRVVLASGDVVDVSRGDCAADGRSFEVRTPSGSFAFDVPSYDMPETKNAAGYFARPGMDLVDLFIGSEGTLGVITEVRVALTPRPEGVLSALAFFDSDDDAVAFVRAARGDAGGGRAVDGSPGADATRDAGRSGSTVSPLALEYFDSHSLDFLRERKAEEGAGSEMPELPVDARAAVLFEQDYVEDDLLDVYEAWEALLAGHGSSMERTWGGMEAAELARLKALRHGVAEEVNSVIARAKSAHPEMHKVGTDAAVPPGSLSEMLSFCREVMDESALRYIIFGHIGDSHVHVNVMPRDPSELRRGKELATAIARRAVELGGTVSAEHGIGKLKHDFLRLMYGDEGLREMAAVKRALDPAGVLNRGVMFPESLLEAA
ncbi:MAG: FAD-binding oxidoreductase [Candidatus Eisenbacteria bacterium]